MSDRPEARAPASGRKPVPMKSYRGPEEIKGLFMNLMAHQQAKERH